MIILNKKDGSDANVKKDNQVRIDIMSREIRLLYYNNYLYEKGIITKREYEKMNLAIIEKCGNRRRKELGERSFEERLSKM